MHIHQFEKIWIGLSLFLIAVCTGIVLYGFAVLDLKVPGITDSGTIDPMNLAETEFAQPGVHQVGDNEYEVYMVVRQFLFLPGTGRPLTLPAGSEVTFHMTSPDVIHGVHIPSTNINSMVIPGQITTFKTVFPEARTYGMICHEYCGPAHHTMEGLIEIVPPSEFDETTLLTSR